ncbi:MAG: 5'-methylthioadenosine/S-adenosylhomocysteine nucleosidase [Bacilli bacterium]|nr:5'-methylthioadenosine/S-adenosylhomocysteine nucleosidase [Bacilli bacterium]
MYAFITPMPLEEEALLKGVTIKERTKFALGEFVEASYEGVDFLVVLCGIGKVFSASMAQATIDKFPGIEGLIVAGVAGSLDIKAAPLHSIVIASKLAQHDFDTTAIGEPMGLLPRIGKVYLETYNTINTKLMKAAPKASYGVMVSGDLFVSEKNKKALIQETFKPYCVDMESAAVAQVCYANRVPFAAIRAISDAENHSDEYEANAEIAADIVGEVIREFLLVK